MKTPRPGQRIRFHSYIYFQLDDRELDISQKTATVRDVHFTPAFSQRGPIIRVLIELDGMPDDRALPDWDGVLCYTHDTFGHSLWVQQLVGTYDVIHESSDFDVVENPSPEGRQVV